MDPTEEQNELDAAPAETSAASIESANPETVQDISSEVATGAEQLTEAATTAASENATSTGLLGDIWASAFNIIELGGPVVTILIIISIFGFAIALFKFFQFSSLSAARFKQMHQAVDHWLAGDKNAAEEQLQKVRWSLAESVKFGLENQKNANDDQLREELTRQANNFLSPYSKFLRPLELIYYLAPVLGLLGTVLGMIEAFKGLEASSGLDKDSTALAGGIWEALLTTAVGLSIAIPFTMIHAWLESRLDAITQMTSDLLTRVLTLDVSAGSNN